DGDNLLDALGIQAGVMQDDATAQGMADQANGEVVDHVEQSREIEDVFGQRVGRAGGPGGIAVATEVERVDVVMGAQRLRDPVPVARVVEGAVDENKGGLGVRAVVPKLQLESIGVKKVGDGFHGDEER